MSEIIALNPKITNAGLTALFNATQNGVAGQISHIAFGDGHGASYEPTGVEIALKRELARVAVGGGEQLDDFTVMIQGLLDAGPSFWMREVGFFLEDGTMLAVWSKPDVALIYKTAGVPFVGAFSMKLSGIPAGSVEVLVTGPNVNIILDRELHLIIANQARITRQQWRQNEAFYAKHGHYPGEQS